MMGDLFVANRNFWATGELIKVDEVLLVISTEHVSENLTFVVLCVGDRIMRWSTDARLEPVVAMMGLDRCRKLQ